MIFLLAYVLTLFHTVQASNYVGVPQPYFLLNYPNMGIPENYSIPSFRPPMIVLRQLNKERFGVLQWENNCYRLDLDESTATKLCELALQYGTAVGSSCNTDQIPPFSWQLLISKEPELSEKLSHYSYFIPDRFHQRIFKTFKEACQSAQEKRLKIPSFSQSINSTSGVRKSFLISPPHLSPVINSAQPHSLTVHSPIDSSHSDFDSTVAQRTRTVAGGGAAAEAVGSEERQQSVSPLIRNCTSPSNGQDRNSGILLPIPDQRPISDEELKPVISCLALLQSRK